MQDKLIKFFNQFFLLFVVVIGGFALRYYSLDKVPPSLNWDEISHGYNAYSILTTMRDEWGELTPIMFRAYGDYKLPLYIYFTAISESFLGLSPEGVRLTSVIAGIGTIIVTYLLVFEIFSNKNINKPPILNRRILALLSAFLVAIEPWTFFLSRGAFEGNLALFFFTLGIFCFIRFTNSPVVNQKFLIGSVIFFGFTVWTYNSYRVFTPLMVFALIFIFRQELASLFVKSSRIVYLSLIILFIFLFPMIYQISQNVGQARYNEVKILDQGTIARIEEQRNLGGTRIVHNRLTYFTWEFINNYFSHFSPRFLFFEGGSHYQFSLPGRGLIYPINLILFYIGLIYLIVNVFKSRSGVTRGYWFLLSMWILLAPISSSLTREAPHVLRSVTFLPLPMILSGLGFFYLASLINKRHFFPALLIYIVILLSFLEVYASEYFLAYPKKFSQAWQYGYKEVVEYAKDNYYKYDKIVVTKKYGEPHEFFLFYGGSGVPAPWPWDPTAYNADPNLKRFYQTNWYWVDKFDKFYFVNDWEISENAEVNIAKSVPDGNIFKLESGELVNCYSGESRCLLITSPENHPDGWIQKNVVNFLDGSPAFQIYANTI